MNARTSSRGFTLIEILIVVAILGVIMAIAVPNFLKTRTQAQIKVCIENLAQIESAKQLWGLENNKKNGDAVGQADLIGPALYMKKMPACPAGGNYEINPIGTVTTCTIDAHTL